jgi:N-acetyl-gamma-glutamyl-phosphate reductase
MQGTIRQGTINAMKRVSVGIVGATGYTGAELVRLLSSHPHVEIAMLVSRSEAGKSLNALLPHLGGVSLPTLSTLDPDALAERCEVVFLAGETGFAMEHAPALLKSGVRVIDLSADFRLRDPTVFQEWYGIPHRAPHLLRDALYGLPELTLLMPIATPA